MRSGAMIGMIAGVGLGMVAGMLIRPAVEPKIRRAIHAGKKFMNSKMCEMEHSLQ